MIKENCAWMLIFLSLVATCLMVQHSLMFSPDVSYLLHATNQMLNGERYGINIFETNPPMILYLYAPTYALLKLTLFSISLETAFYIYCFTLLILSSLTIFMLMKKLINSDKNIYFYTLYIIILCSLYILPLIAYGQREHFLFIFLIPYLLLIALRLENKKISWWIATSIAVFASLGFALKPYFLPTFVLLELLIISQRKSFYAWFRLEIFVILSIWVLYLASILIFNFNYLTIILPLLNKYYFFAVKQPLAQIFGHIYVIFCFITALLYPLFYYYDKYKNIGSVFWIALIGMIFSFMIPQNIWYYHVYPAIALAFILIIHCMTQQIIVHKNYFKENFIIILILIIFLWLPIKSIYYIWYEFHINSKNYATEAMVKYINKFPGTHTINCFTILGTRSCFPAIDNIHNVSYQSSFPSFWWYKGMTLAWHNCKDPQTKLNIIKDKNYLFAKIADDLNLKQPRWVIIDNRYLSANDLFNMLNSNSEFLHAWQAYRYKTNIDDYIIYARK